MPPPACANFDSGFFRVRGGGGGLYLRDHRDPVQFRNIRAVEPAK